MVNNELFFSVGRSPIRNQEILIRQLKTDYAECKKLLARVQNQSSDDPEIEKFIQSIAWIKTEINEIRRISRDMIEGTNLGEMEEIEREIHLIQKKFNRLILK